MEIEVTADDVKVYAIGHDKARTCEGCGAPLISEYGEEPQHSVTHCLKYLAAEIAKLKKPAP